MNRKTGLENTIMNMCCCMQIAAMCSSCCTQMMNDFHPGRLMHGFLTETGKNREERRQSGHRRKSHGHFLYDRKYAYTRQRA